MRLTSTFFYAERDRAAFGAICGRKRFGRERSLNWLLDIGPAACYSARY